MLSELEYKNRRMDMAWSVPVSAQAKLLLAFMGWASDPDGAVPLSRKQIAFKLGLGTQASNEAGYEAMSKKVQRWMRELREAGLVRSAWGDSDQGAYLLDVQALADASAAAASISAPIEETA